jgi:hypothetical protein
MNGPDSDFNNGSVHGAEIATQIRLVLFTIHPSILLPPSISILIHCLIPFTKPLPGFLWFSPYNLGRIPACIQTIVFSARALMATRAMSLCSIFGFFHHRSLKRCNGLGIVHPDSRFRSTNPSLSFIVGDQNRFHRSLVDLLTEEFQHPCRITRASSKYV